MSFPAFAWSVRFFSLIASLGLMSLILGVNPEEKPWARVLFFVVFFWRRRVVLPGDCFRITGVMSMKPGYGDAGFWSRHFSPVVCAPHWYRLSIFGRSSGGRQVLFSHSSF